MVTNRELVCTYKAKSKKKWMDGCLVIVNKSLVLFDSKNKEIDACTVQRVELDGDSVVMEYHEVMCDEMEVLKSIVKASEKDRSAKTRIETDKHCKDDNIMDLSKEVEETVQYPAERARSKEDEKKTKKPEETEKIVECTSMDKTDEYAEILKCSEIDVFPTKHTDIKEEKRSDTVSPQKSREDLLSMFANINSS
ncbi:hypothetical protein NEMIN01_1032 [Nematocida minor]|uniref:uncharacterized protein n=1 Tax=Nematocida minor TaxID=1912983 RepID=UPI00221F60C8|nr:uncharacterized protein NEMIN01_1032 [Nematocida minor]KAI5190408.1 hypothetical protein NEMIN01_1032 [Nematocida minor]